MRRRWPWLVPLIGLTVTTAGARGEYRYDLLLKGGHVIDPKNDIDGVRDVAIWGGRIACLGRDLPSDQARTVVPVGGLYVVPGLVDIHAHVYNGTGARHLAGDLSVIPDAHTFRSGVTTIVDAGTSGWRTFPDFKDRVIDRSQTRVLAWLNIVGRGMSGRPYEQKQDDMDPAATAALALQFPDRIVGIKTAHYDGPEWIAVDRALEAAELARLPVMVDFGTFRPERPYQRLVLEKLRPGDISTHMYVSTPRAAVPLFDEQGHLLPYLGQARQRGVKFDVGHGFESFAWAQVVPAVRQGWLPDSISTDLYARSMNAALKDMTTVMSKFLSLGVPLADVIRMSTLTPARLIRRPDLGHLDVGAVADVAVLNLREGEFGFLDVRNVRRPARHRLECELTLREGRVVWDLNGRAGEEEPPLSDVPSTPGAPHGPR
ncbi:MAG: amidohydrolase/deacetylase family metallohydrolase [Isosphaeraceae bacterium]|nr:amidohydrolase/deacetylase family metallohydrolase [Isosphaeraceae bacterium]